MHHAYGMSSPTISRLSIAENIAISKGVYLTTWTINICPLVIPHKVLLNTICEKSAISKVNYNY